MLHTETIQNVPCPSNQGSDLWVLYSVGHSRTVQMGECLPIARPARYFSINFPDFSPRFTL